MSEYIIHYKDAETLYEHTDFPFLLEEYLREPIVRCHDCNSASFDEFGGGWCNENCREIKAWNFCAWGEWRGE